MTTFKVGDVVVPKPEELGNVVKQWGYYSVGPVPSSFTVREVDRLPGVEPLLCFSNGFKVYAYRMQHCPLKTKSLEDYL